MTEIVIAAASAIVGWAASVEYRLGQLNGMKDQVNAIYEHLLGQNDEPRATEEGPRKRRG